MLNFSKTICGSKNKTLLKKFRGFYFFSFFLGVNIGKGKYNCGYAVGKGAYRCSWKPTNTSRISATLPSSATASPTE